MLDSDSKLLISFRKYASEYTYHTIISKPEVEGMFGFALKPVRLRPSAYGLSFCLPTKWNGMNWEIYVGPYLNWIKTVGSEQIMLKLKNDISILEEK